MGGADPAKACPLNICKGLYVADRQGSDGGSCIFSSGLQIRRQVMNAQMESVRTSYNMGHRLLAPPSVGAWSRERKFSCAFVSRIDK